MRRILCPECSKVWLNYQSSEEAWMARTTIRRTEITKSKRPDDPAENRIVINGTKIIPIPHDEVICDDCNENIYGKPAVAITIWACDEQIPDMWEDGFQG